MPQARATWNARFGHFEANLTTGELFRDGKRLPLQNRPFRMLEILLRSGGELVERERMLVEVWPDAHVGNRSINTAIRKLRLALDDDAANPRMIETVGSRGHRLMIPVEFRSQERAASGRDDTLRLMVMPFHNLGAPDDDLVAGGFSEQMIVQLRRTQYDLFLIAPFAPAPRKGSERLVPAAGRDAGVDYYLNGSVLSGARI